MDLTPMDDLDYGNLYDQIDDLIDYPLDNECSNGGLLDSGDCKTFPSICNGALPDITEPFLLGSNGNLASDLSAEISVPNEDILELEWLPAFMEDSFSGDGMTLTMDIFKKKEPSQNPFLSTSSPVSVLESSRNSSSCSLGLKFSPITRARTKRPRPATFSPCTSFPLPSPNPMSHEKHLIVHSGISSESEGIEESENGKKYHKPQEKMKPKIPLGLMEIKQKNGTRSVIRCQHCRITNTPQWRTGPMGPKTLCNACGVRYKSGRLLPEYRPVASPTFVPYLHSNRHRKVIKMRKKLVQEKSVVVKQRARTKRPRPATFSPCTSPPNPPSHENHVIVLSGSSSESESVGESENGKKYHKLQAIEEKMITPKIPLGPIDVNKNKNGTQAVRRCQQCMITKTLHWRNGPMGPKTLCNACGVRFNSKRLFPERCPAASPSFAPYLHSNSHRKVTETRNELVEEKSVDVTQRARTKRPRSATYCPCTSVQLTSPNPPSHENHLTVLSGISSETEGCGEPENGKKKKYHNPQAMEEKMITPKIPLGPMDVKQNKNGTHEVKRCQHCAITKTLQWRNGPMGPKTLCNACGVRYNSGRLLPEYRPAASPTFVPSLHSNSHRQVIEMRNNKLVEEKSVDVAARERLH